MWFVLGKKQLSIVILMWLTICVVEYQRALG